jgi:hypothetical protein
MRKLVFIFLVSIANLKAQVPADSLRGVYIGLRYYAIPSSSPWVITQDTVYVTSVDSAICKVQANDLTLFSYGGDYYTDYYSCNGTAPTNFFMKFYSSDSVKLIHDNEPFPPPAGSRSLRFFGKRVSPLINGVSDKTQLTQLMVYPNPCSDFLFFNSSFKSFRILISDILHPEAMMEAVVKNNSPVNLSDLPSGIYFLRVKTDSILFFRKLMIQH